MDPQGETGQLEELNFVQLGFGRIRLPFKVARMITVLHSTLLLLLSLLDLSLERLYAIQISGGTA
jgi:hypothetical protein